MQIVFNNLPSLTKLIETMDQHRFGAAMFVIVLLILLVALLVYSNMPK